MAAFQRLFALASAVAVVAFSVPAQVHAAVVYDESISGSFSNDNFSPTVVNLLPLGAGLAPSSSTVIGQTQGFSADIFTVQVAAGTLLDSLFLDDYNGAGGDGGMYVAIDDADTFPNDYFQVNDQFFLPNTSVWLAGRVIGEDEEGMDVLPLFGNAPQGTGFVGPLGEGDYTFYIQQTGPANSYELRFNVTTVPEPASMAAVAGIIGLVGFRRKRRLLAAKTKKS